MKQLFFFYLFWCASHILSSQNNCWYSPVPTAPTSFNLNGVFFIDFQTGWAVGNSGTILNTTDGGTSWQKQTSGTNVDLTAVHFEDLQTGWIVGKNGVILKTENAGSSWGKQTSPINTSLEDVLFISLQTGWIVGGNGTILKTTDGGIQWQIQASGITGWLQSVYFNDSLTGWVVGGDPIAGLGRILKTTDGGATWEQNLPGAPWLTGIYFTDSLTGWAVGQFGAILKTADGGQNWQAKMPPHQSPWLMGVHFTDSQNGWAVGLNGTILQTSDGGETWTKQESGTLAHLSDVQFPYAQTGWIVGTEGKILKYSAVPDPVADFSWLAEAGVVQFSSTSTGAYTYLWNFGDGQTSGAKNPQHTYASAGEYLVTLTITNACGSISTVEKIISITSGVAMPAFLTEFAIFPNPAGDYFTLTLSGDPQKIVLMELLDGSGRIMMRETPDFQSGTVLKRIDCRDWPAGMYLLRVSDGHKSGFRKIIVE